MRNFAKVVLIAIISVASATAVSLQTTPDCCSDQCYFAKDSSYSWRANTSFISNPLDPSFIIAHRRQMKQVDINTQQTYEDLYWDWNNGMQASIQLYKYQNNGNWFVAAVLEGTGTQGKHCVIQPSQKPGELNGMLLDMPSQTPKSAYKIEVAGLEMVQWNFGPSLPNLDNTTVIWSQQTCIPISTIWSDARSVPLARIDYYDVKGEIVDPDLFILPSICNKPQSSQSLSSLQSIPLRIKNLLEAKKRFMY